MERAQDFTVWNLDLERAWLDEFTAEWLADREAQMRVNIREGGRMTMFQVALAAVMGVPFIAECIQAFPAASTPCLTASLLVTMVIDVVAFGWFIRIVTRAYRAGTLAEYRSLAEGRRDARTWTVI